MKWLVCFSIGVILCILVTGLFEHRMSKQWEGKLQRIEQLENELYKTRLEVRKFWKENILAWSEVARVKRRLSESQDQ